MTDRARRRYISAGVAIATAGFATIPQRWQRPVIDSIILPTHAQTSEPPLLMLSAGLFAVEVGPRADSGGSPEPAIISLTTRSCTNVATVLDLRVVATLAPAGSVELVVAEIATGASTTTTSNIAIEAPVFVPVASVTALTLTFNGAGASYVDTVTGAALTAVLTGSTSGFSCSF